MYGTYETPVEPGCIIEPLYGVLFRILRGQDDITAGISLDDALQNLEWARDIESQGMPQAAGAMVALSFYVLTMLMC